MWYWAGVSAILARPAIWAVRFGQMCNILCSENGQLEAKIR